MHQKGKKHTFIKVETNHCNAIKMMYRIIWFWRMVAEICDVKVFSDVTYRRLFSGAQGGPIDPIEPFHSLYGMSMTHSQWKPPETSVITLCFRENFRGCNVISTTILASWSDGYPLCTTVSTLVQWAYHYWIDGPSISIWVKRLKKSAQNGGQKKSSC